MSYSKHDDSNVEKIDYVEFGILSPEQIIEQSVVEVTSHNTYCGNTPVANGLFDPKMGTLEIGNICPTDLLSSKLTPGYFGHINLAVPVFHFQFFNQVQKIFKCICYRCATKLSNIDHSHVEKKTKLNFHIESSKKVKICQNCSANQPLKYVKTDLCKFHLLWTNDEKLEISAKYALNLFKLIKNETVVALGFDPEISHPKNMIMTVYPVCPPICRPSINQDSGARLEDDVTIKYCDILKFNNMIREKLNSDPKAKILEDWSNILQYHCATLMDNEITGIMQSAQRSGRPLKGIRQRLKGKEGRIRGNLMGKRVNFSARSVITPDPIIDLDELGVPKKIALKMTFPEKVTDKNIKRLRNAVRNGCMRYPGARSVWKHMNNKTISLNHIDIIAFANMIEVGDIVIRHIINGDVVLFNRQPSLHKMSMMAHRVRVLDGSTFRLNVSATTPYNADFDGDEMNMHVPQSIATANEIEQLASVKTQIVSPATNFPIISFVQDTVLGGYLISIKDSTFTRCEFMNTCNDDLNVLRRFGNKKFYNGFELLSSCLPPDLNIKLKNNEGKTIDIRNGIITDTGSLDKKVFTKLIHYIFNDYGYNICSEFFNKTQKVVRAFLLRDSFSVGIRDIMNNQEIDKEIVDKINQQNLEVQKKIHQIHSNMFENTIDSKKVAFETKVMQNLNKARSSAEILLKSIHDNNKQNRFMNMVNSGAKGKLINLAQMTACLGQQIIEGKRVPNGIKDRTLPHFQKFDETGIARGFVESSFKTGLNPLEFFFHAMAGREGIIDTACKTASTGYIQRKLIKALEDLKICESNTVTDSQNNIIQYLFGDDSIDATTLEYISVPIVSVTDFKKEYEISKADSETKGLLKKFTTDISTMFHWYKNIYNGYPDDKMKFPVNFNRILHSVSNSVINDDTAISENPKITVKYILNEYQKLIRDLTIHRFNNGTWMFKFLLYQIVHPKRIIQKINLSKRQFDTFISTIKSKFRNSHIHSGEAVGAVAAQSIGEPCTQLTLNTFHLSGVGAKSTVTRGVPRLQEIFHLTKNPKNPSMTLKLFPKWSQNISSVQKVSNEITLISIKELLSSSEIQFEIENPFNDVDTYITNFYVKFGIEQKETSKWILTLKFDDKKLHEKGIEIDDIYHSISTHFPNELRISYSDDNSFQNIIRIKIDKHRLKNSELKRYVTTTNIPEIEILAAVERYIMNDIIIRGANDIEKSHIRKDNETNSFVIDTLGSNIVDVVNHPMIDANKCVSNDFHEMNQIFGIEVARNCIINELIEVLEEAADIDIRHIQILADSMTNGGILCPIDRNGMRQNNSSVLQKISFEESVQQLFKASMHGEQDNLENCSASIMFGQNPKIGTGSVDIIFDQTKHLDLIGDHNDVDIDFDI